MKSKSIKRKLTFFLLLLSFNLMSFAAGAQVYEIDPSRSTIVADATSTLHLIKIDMKDFRGEFRFNKVKQQLDMQGDVYVRIESLVSGKKGLDRNMYRTLDSKKHPQSHCQIKSMVFTPPTKDKPVSATLKAVLTIRDISQPFESEVLISVIEDGFSLKGSAVFSIKSFKLKPPTILGVIRMHDKVTVNFDVFIRP